MAGAFFAAFCFVLGLIAGAFVWIPVTLRRVEKDRELRAADLERRFWRQ